MGKYKKVLLFVILLFQIVSVTGQTTSKGNKGNIIDLVFSDLAKDPSNKLFIMGEAMLNEINDKNGWSRKETSKIARSINSYKVLTIEINNHGAGLKLFREIESEIHNYPSYKKYLQEEGHRYSIIYTKGTNPKFSSEIVIVYLRDKKLRISSFAGDNLDVKGMY
ncbi:DUF4252 domain-containing protein [Sphingobacterium sp. UME9]|uniref:DUF4252 domain-containing protein n=1 Tax=Sphingobacterium sp. UME9 TaxID=1862316 RepID=UPI0016038668|nr:DUF4252 domain-containing protein [Sphingobacterium sp. UME9]MBB1647682.1 hypothetical protein [Sphingobacterium sp. UME9]